ncbi:hypothetical protein H9P43_004792 [Blastocladiella emersonii ATCC 22665]|nr:hypothetical protein H9P43_004787 [Blastocladiella emersonii ATCC 22665]KAI9179467.1 hypothetical protein H9P43_004792 [Blastocladiella emersonii ATCC 22665]
MNETKLHKTVVIDVVALTRDLVTPDATPFLAEYFENTAVDISPTFPAVTCSAQTTYLTGVGVGEHGVTGNNLYDRLYGEHRNWHQSAGLVRSPRLFQRVKEADPRATTFSNCWWFPMGDRFLDYAITPRPQYLADGGKAADIWTKPESLRHSLQSPPARGGLGTFPLHKFWGPGASIASTQWIVDATIRVDRQYDPTFSVVYLPHLDYTLQKVGPDPRHPAVLADLRAVDAEVARLVAHYETTNPETRIIILSEYGIQPVSRPVHINRVLREAGFVGVRAENGGETLDPYASRAFAIPDHQVAHVYVNDQSADPPLGNGNVSAGHAAAVEAAREVLLAVPGVAQVLRRDLGEVDRYYDPSSGRVRTSDHHFCGKTESRTGDLVVVADHDAWFTYYYWTSPDAAPDFAYTINIHRKPGYDPVEMFYAFTSPVLGFTYLVFKALLVYALRIRTIVDGTRFDAHRIGGSHGATRGLDRRYWPVLATKRRGDFVAGAAGRGGSGVGEQSSIAAEDVYHVIWAHLTRP